VACAALAAVFARAIGLGAAGLLAPAQLETKILPSPRPLRMDVARTHCYQLTSMALNPAKARRTAAAAAGEAAPIPK
jgi:hypothetical protein